MKIEERGTRESNEQKLEQNVARINFLQRSLEEWRREQMADPVLAEIYRVKQAGRYPTFSEIPPEEISAKIYKSYWDALFLENGVLYKRWHAPNLKSSFLQLVVLRSLVREILEQTHDSSLRGHFGVNKTLEKIRKRFFWATCKQDVED